MNSPKDDARKDLRPGDPKRPHATIELKATEIKPASPAPGGSATDAKPAAATPDTAKTTETGKTAEAGKPGAATTTAATSAGTAATGASATATGPSATGGKTPSSTAPAGKPAAAAGAAKDTAKDPAGKPTPAAASPSHNGGSGFSRILTHATAGLVGGFIALLGADALAPQLKELGIPVGLSSSKEETEQLRQRLFALEKSQKSAPAAADADLAEKVAAANAKLAKLDTFEKRLATIADGQSKLESEAAALARKVTEEAGAGKSDERVGKLEEQLQLLTKAAEGSQGSAAIPQLAAVTGRVADLQSTVANQLASLRKSVSEEIDTRISRAAEAAEAARSGSQRMDRELSDLKSENARITQRLEAMKSEDARVAETLRIAQEETGRVAAAIDALKGDVTQRFKTFARPDDVAQALTPLKDKLGELEKGVASVVTAEDNRKANAERIVLSLELANLKRVVDRGMPYAEELAQVKKAAGGRIDLAALDKYKSDGVPTLPELQKAFQPLSHSIIAAAEQPEGGSVVDRLLAGAKSVVRVRKVNHASDDDSVEAIVSRMDKALDEGRVTDFMSLKPKLPAAALAPAASFLQKVEARNAVDKALGEIESQLKTSLGSTAEAPATR